MPEPSSLVAIYETLQAADTCGKSIRQVVTGKFHAMLYFVLNQKDRDTYASDCIIDHHWYLHMMASVTYVFR